MSGRVKKPAAPKKKANGYKMPPPITCGEVIDDKIQKKKWRIGPSIGVGGFGEIYSACDHESSPKKADYPFVIKIEPHENGPLFVEKHFYIRNANKNDIEKFKKDKKLNTFGMPSYYGNGSHEYKGEKFRYLVLERYGKDLWSIFMSSNRVFPAATVFQIGIQMLDVLEYIHSRGYLHGDIKGANILLGLKKGTENQCYLVDFGLASKVNDKEFKPEPKCAHDGTIEYTSRDAHLGVPTMRGDLEILGYNMLQWLVGELPWEKCLKTPKKVQELKENFLKNVRANITKEYKNVPDSLIKFFEYINTLKPKEVPDHAKCRQLFESQLKIEKKTINSKLEFTPTKSKATLDPEDDTGSENKPKPAKKARKKTSDSPKAKRPRKQVVSDEEVEENSENEKPKIITNGKRKSDPAFLINRIKKTLTPKATPPAKKNHVNMGTQTSVEQRRRTPRQVTFNSPVSAIIGANKPLNTSKEDSANSSGDIFDDSFTMEGKKVAKPRRKLLSTEKVTIKKTITKKNIKGRSWKDMPTVVNGRSPPK